MWGAGTWKLMMAANLQSGFSQEGQGSSKKKWENSGKEMRLLLEDYWLFQNLVHEVTTCVLGFSLALIIGLP